MNSLDRVVISIAFKMAEKRQHNPKIMLPQSRISKINPNREV